MKEFNTVKVSAIQTNYLFESLEQASQFCKDISKLNIPYDTVSMNKSIVSIYRYN